VNWAKLDEVLVQEAHEAKEVVRWIESTLGQMKQVAAAAKRLSDGLGHDPKREQATRSRHGQIGPGSKQADGTICAGSGRHRRTGCRPRPADRRYDRTGAPGSAKPTLAPIRSRAVPSRSRCGSSRRATPSSIGSTGCATPVRHLRLGLLRSSQPWTAPPASCTNAPPEGVDLEHGGHGG